MKMTITLASPQTSANDDPEGAVRSAFEAHRAMVFRRVLIATHDEALADDVVQDAFASLLVEVQGGRMPENVGGWLHRVAMNAVVSRARHAEVERRYQPALVRSDITDSPERAVEAREQARQIRQALSALPLIDRTAILLAANGASGAEIAGRLGRTELAARTLLCRARARLRRDLALA
jgi:RNA polymerase sigma-70 factor (ECF subfamily)